MGADAIALRALTLGKRLGLLDFDRTITLGRQEILFSPADYDQLVARCPDCLPRAASTDGFLEPVLQSLGASVVESVDASGYEGASIVADFNEPLDSQHHGRFTCFIDFGTMEHIFDVRRVLLNLNKLLAPYGTALIVTNANGFVGHGFYQFSPELFYSCLSARNGFSESKVFLVDCHHPRRWHYVYSPSLLGTRNHAPYDRQFYVLCFTKKTADVDEIRAQQSDYVSAWQHQGHRHYVATRGTVKFLRRLVGPALYEIGRRAYRRLRATDRRMFSAQTVYFDPERITVDEFTQMTRSN